MRFFICLLLVSFFFSCGESKEDDFRFRNGRSKTNKKIRQSKTDTSSKKNQPSGQETKQNQLKKFFLPIKITKDLPSLHIKSNDNKRIQFSSEAGTISLLAIQNGVLSVNDSETSYHLVISLNNNRSFNFLLEKSATTLKASAGQQIKEKEIIAETTGLTTFYILENGKELTLCLHNIESSVPIIKELSSDNC